MDSGAVAATDDSEIRRSPGRIWVIYISEDRWCIGRKRKENAYEEEHRNKYRDRNRQQGGKLAKNAVLVFEQVLMRMCRNNKCIECCHKEDKKK